MTETIAPRLSFVIVARRFAHPRRVIEHLLRQTALAEIELVLVTEDRATFAADQTLLSRFPHHVVIEHGPIRRIADAVAHGMRAARAPLVMWGEDHAFPAPDYAERVLARAHEPWTAIGPGFRNANPTVALGWAMLLTSYTVWVEATGGGEQADIPGHDSSYRREALLALGDDLPALLEPQGGLHARLRAEGGTLLFDPGITIHHINPSRIDAALQHRFDSGVRTATLRSTRERWSVIRRIAHAVALPLWWARRTRWALGAWLRIRRAPLRCAGDAARSPAVPAWIALAGLFASLGEAFGALAGDTDSAIALAEFELDRSRLRSVRDQVVVTG